MAQIDTKKHRFRWRVIAAALAPFLAASGYLILSRWPSYKFTTFSDYAAWGGSILMGAVFVATMPIPLHQRIRWLLIYIPVVGAVLVIYTFAFIAVVFGDSL